MDSFNNDRELNHLWFLVNDLQNNVLPNLERKPATCTVSLRLAEIGRTGQPVRPFLAVDIDQMISLRCIGFKKLLALWEFQYVVVIKILTLDICNEELCSDK